MLADQSLREGKLDESLAQLEEQVRKDPSSSKHRIFLFQLLAVMGQWDRAMTQLEVAGELDHGALAMVQTYRVALRCEAMRGQVFSGDRSPLVLGEPEQWVALLLEALRLLAAGKHRQSTELREQALEAAPPTAGSIDAQPFEWIADADSRMGPILEAIVNGDYYWIPFHRIRDIRIEEPSDLRDVVWLPAQFTWANGGQTVGLIPTRYPGSEKAERQDIVTARRTEWVEHGDDAYLGLGQRMLATDAGEFSLMDVRLITLTPGEQAEESAEGQGART